MQQIDDVERYRDEYVPAVQPLLQKHDAEMLVGVGSIDAEPAQGDPPNSTLVIRFAHVEAAWAFVNDPGYQPVKEIRLSATSRGQAVVAPGFTPGRVTVAMYPADDGSPSSLLVGTGGEATKRAPEREGARVARR